MQDVNVCLDVAALAAEMLLESSAETYRAEETARRMCAAFGVAHCEILAFPTGFTLAVVEEDGRSNVRIRRIRARSLRLQAIDGVNAISRQAAAGQLDAAQALQRLQALQRAPAPAMWLQVLAYALSAGFFAVMFGGGARELMICALCGAAVQLLAPGLDKLHLPTPLQAMVSGALAAVVSQGLLQVWSASQEAVITGAIMPLLPGLSMTNAIRDTMRGDLISGLARGMEALLSTVLLAAGVALGLML